MKAQDIGLKFDIKLSRSSWASVSLLDSYHPDLLWVGEVPTMIGNITVIGAGETLCYLGFEKNRSLERCLAFFPDAVVSEDRKSAATMVDRVIGIWRGEGAARGLDIILNGTAFQQKVWKALMKIPTGHVVSYKTIAESIGHDKAVRAVGSAVGANPVSLIIPCHRVIQQSGKVENYGWGDAMKQKILMGESGVSA